MELHPWAHGEAGNAEDKREIVWVLMAKEESQGGLHGGFHSRGTERERQ